MPFFDGSHFSQDFYRSPFFGDPYFKHPFFEDAHISHIISCSIVDERTIKAITDKRIIGEIDALCMKIKQGKKLIEVDHIDILDEKFLKIKTKNKIGTKEPVYLKYFGSNSGNVWRTNWIRAV